MVLPPQLFPPCKLAIRMCDARIPLISDIVCTGAFGYCQGTQVRGYGPVPSLQGVCSPTVAHTGAPGFRAASTRLLETNLLHACGTYALQASASTCDVVQFDTIRRLGGNFNIYDVRKTVRHWTPRADAR